MSDQMKPECSEVLDHLALIVDGDEETLNRFADHLAECDACRDARHDATLTAELVAHAGADYQPPADLAERVLAAVDEQSASGLKSTYDQSQSDVAATSGVAVVDPTPSGSTLKASTSEVPKTVQGPVQKRSKVVPIVMAAAALLLILGGAGIWLAQSDIFSGDDEQDGHGGGIAGRGPGSQVPTPLPEGTGTNATIAQIVRAASDGATGVSVRQAATGPFALATVDAQINPGGAIRTDDRTRVRLNLADGTELTLNHNTELTLDGQTPRLIHLASGGEVLADVAHVESAPPAVFRTPTGRVEVLGTKLLVSTTDEVATVRVTRGHVRVHGDTGQPVDVKAGEEATLPRGEAAQVAQAVNLAGSVAWSEIDETGEQVDRTSSGLGKLAARRPGEREGTERPLKLTSHKVRVRIVGNVARTEVEEVFRNDSGVTLEGIYSFPMPPDARIARLALDVEGRMEDGAFVERDQAAKIWAGVIRRATPRRERQRQQEFIWVPGPWRDPALLEWQRGGQFQLRVFPIPAHGERRVIIAYDQTVQPHGGGRRYVYPLPHSGDDSTRVGLFDLDVRVAGADPAAPVKSHGYQVTASDDGPAKRLKMTQANFQPAGDVVIDYALAGADQELRWWTYQGPAAAAPAVEARSQGSKRGSAPEVVAAQRALAADQRPYAVFALRPELPLRTQSRPRDYVIVVDSSQSMVGERFARANQLVTGIVAEMDRRDRFSVMACDALCQAKPGGPRAPSVEAANETQQWLAGIRPAGASDVIQALNEAASTAGQSGPDRDVRILYIGDGISSVGHRRASAIAANVQTLMQGNPRYTFTTVGIGGDADTMVLSAVARAGGGHYVPYVPGQRANAAALRILETTYGVSLRNAQLEFPAGVTEVAPGGLPTIRAGEEIIVAARFTGEVRGEVVLRGTVGGEAYVDRYPITLTPSTAAGNAFVPRLWAAAQIQELELGGRGADEHRIVALSRGYGVMSRHTSLLVLESEAMFRAFRVDRARPTVDWTGEDDASSEGSDGTESHGGPTVLSGLGGMGTGRGGGGAVTRRARRSSAAGAGDSAMGGLMGGAPAASAPAPAPRARPRRDMDRAAAEEREMSPAEPRQQQARRRGPGRWMRRVWERVGSVSRSASERPRDRQAVIEAEAALTQAPDSRDRHRALVRALARVGDLPRAAEVAEQWISRDQLDPEALIFLSDILGRQGHRDDAVRLLSGIVDLEPDNATLHTRLAEAFERSGEANRACSHRIAIAERDGADADDIAGALRCERALGHHTSATQILDGLTDATLRTRAERQASRTPRNRGVRGDLMLEATWVGPQDLDLTLVNRRGQRISWLGGRTNVVGDSARVPGRERLGLRWTPVGTYYIEISRTDPTDTTPITGQISVRLLRSRQTLNFTLTGTSATVGSVRVRREARMVPGF